MRKQKASVGGRGKSQRGFTLLETSIALVVLMFVGLSAASLFTYAVTNNASASDRAMALAVAQQQVEQLRSVSFENMETTITAMGGSPKTVYTAGRPYSITTSFAYTPTTATASTATSKTVTVTATPQGGSGTLTSNSVTLTIIRSTLDVGSYSK